MLSREKCDGRESCFRLPGYIIRVTDFLSGIEAFVKYGD